MLRAKIKKKYLNFLSAKCHFYIRKNRSLLHSQRKKLGNANPNVMIERILNRCDFPMLSFKGRLQRIFK